MICTTFLSLKSVWKRASRETLKCSMLDPVLWLATETQNQACYCVIKKVFLCFDCFQPVFLVFSTSCFPTNMTEKWEMTHTNPDPEKGPRQRFKGTGLGAGSKLFYPFRLSDCMTHLSLTLSVSPFSPCYLPCVQALSANIVTVDSHNSQYLSLPLLSHFSLLWSDGRDNKQKGISVLCLLLPQHISCGVNE